MRIIKRTARGSGFSAQIRAAVTEQVREMILSPTRAGAASGSRAAETVHPDIRPMSENERGQR